MGISMPKGNKQPQQKASNFKEPSKVEEHLRNHVQYPADSKKIEESCNSMSCVLNQEDKAALRSSLPQRQYRSADEALQAVNLKKAQ